MIEENQPMSHALNNNENKDCVESVHNFRGVLPISRHMEGWGSNEEQRIDGHDEWITSNLNNATTTPKFIIADMMVPKTVIQRR